MRQRTTVLVVVAVAALAVFASAATATATGLDDVRSGTSGPAAVTAATDGAATDSVSPGQRLTGVVGAQRAEVEGEIETRAFGVRVATASSSRAKAGVVAAEVNDLEARLETLQNRRAELERAHENGSVSDGVYQARVTALVARIETTGRLVNATDAVANDLPENELEAAGVRQSNIAQLRQRAVNLSEGETADLARSIVGDDVGEGMGNPASDVLDTVASGNFGAGGLVGGDATETGTGTGAPDRTGTPGRATDRSGGRTPGVDAGANVSAGVGANAGDGTETGTLDGDATATVGAGVDRGDPNVGVNAESGTATDETGTPTNETTANATIADTTTATSTTTTTTTDSPFAWDSATTTASTPATATDATTTSETETAA